MPRWFLIINGVGLLVMGLALLSMRLRERPFHRHMFGIVWALLCCAVGGGLLLMASGYIEQPGAPGPQAIPRSKLPEFPTGR
jgi:hypothetical protein